MSKVSVKRLAMIIGVGIGLCVLVYYAPAFLIKEDKPPTYPRLQTGGTSVVAFLLENRWRDLYRKKKNIQVDYASVGSTKGVKGMIEGTYAVGFTHAALTEEQMQQAQGRGGPVLHLPVVICAVVPIYHLKELKDKPPLKFTGEVLADIFRGKIDRWDDPALKQLNEGVDLPSTKITVVHREDSSGTTFIFTDYLSGASEGWRKEIGPASNKIKWPVGVGKPRNNGVADHVYRTNGTIGYVDLLWAGYGREEESQLRNVQHGAVQNKDQSAFIHAEAANMTAALQGQLGALPENLTFRLTNQPGKDAYPICGCVWAVCYQAQPATKKQQVVDFLTWIAHDGQRFATDMSYAPLPEELVQRVDDKLKTVKTIQ